VVVNPPIAPVPNVAVPPPPGPAPAGQIVYEHHDPIVIIGTPGTGKTTLGLYLLYLILANHANHAVIYRHGNANPGFFIHFQGRAWNHPSISEAFNIPLFVQMMTNGGTTPIWSVLDSFAAIPTGTAQVNQILIISPGSERDMAVAGMLEHTRVLINPPWTIEEMEMVRQHAYFTQFNSAEMKEAFDHWGGTPGTVFKAITILEKHEQLAARLTRGNLAHSFLQAGRASVNYQLDTDFHFHLIPGQEVPNGIPDTDSSVQFCYGAYC
jgi:hypothetical protein